MERKTTVSITLGVASDGRSVRCDFNLAPSPMATAAPALAAPVVPPPVPPRKKAVPRQLFAPEEGNTPKSIWAAWNDEDVPNGKVVDLKGNSVTTLNSPDCVATVMDAPPFLMALDDLNMPEEKSKRTTSMRSSSTQTTAHEPWVAFAAVIVAICITCCSAMLLRSAFTFDADDSSYSGLQAAGCASQTPTTPPLEPMRRCSLLVEARSPLAERAILSCFCACIFLPETNSFLARSFFEWPDPWPDPG